MKQWLYDGWVKFKRWYLFTFWRFFHSKEDREQLRKFYDDRLSQKYRMDLYVAFIGRQSEKEKVHFKPESWYVGDLKADRFEIVDEYYKAKKDED
ncbi:hypothetical protein UFOVP908_228 [uncultured Caudovirales phage]|uniref:Uncharacterized protein n=1 Tax=uncultured Caudovirales phage TaxID=2100421 RepID=A0A6J5T3P1_9CAUD|nr:hypothetical protein UFOVP908_228 [uncultured Caudovirales phage]CAB4177025.1 hypothetical protein UFOVP990_141 [uncultured Caudovirales phage]CAB4182203.1 hypothetical protein UFOVP1065_172 [uncultured Caudovirales phage]CAB4190801.1 hypothetical protein UFOVP1198_141 [uncultured Caudovirales phage]CAB4211150.1 hypothetical protein UFOVP1418_133 [uncultured Caudovirales phage]